MTRFTTAALALGALLVSTSALSAQNGCDIKKAKFRSSSATPKLTAILTGCRGWSGLCRM